MFSAFGFIGQSIYNSADSQKVATAGDGQPQVEKPSVWQRLAESKWTPVKYVSDEDYQKMLEEKLLSVEAELALLDEKIEKMRKLKDETTDHV